jgi:hypothetical protein
MRLNILSKTAFSRLWKHLQLAGSLTLAALLFTPPQLSFGALTANQPRQTLFRRATVAQRRPQPLASTLAQQETVPAEQARLAYEENLRSLIDLAKSAYQNHAQENAQIGKNFDTLVRQDAPNSILLVARANGAMVGAALSLPLSAAVAGANALVACQRPSPRPTAASIFAKGIKLGSQIGGHIGAFFSLPKFLVTKASGLVIGPLGKIALMPVTASMTTLQNLNRPIVSMQRILHHESLDQANDKISAVFDASQSLKNELPEPTREGIDVKTNQINSRLSAKITRLQDQLAQVQAKLAPPRASQEDLNLHYNSYFHRTLTRLPYGNEVSQYLKFSPEATVNALLEEERLLQKEILHLELRKKVNSIRIIHDNYYQARPQDTRATLTARLQPTRPWGRRRVF